MKAGWLARQFDDVLEIRNGKNQREVESKDGEYPIFGSAGNVMGYATSYICEAGTTIIGRKGNINTPIFSDTKFWNVDTAFGLAAKPGLDSKFLYYYCLSFDFGALNRGTTIPSLVKSELLRIPIPLPPLAEQKRIVTLLDEAFAHIATAKANAEQNLQNARALFESYLQSVFSQGDDGWLDRRLGDIFYIGSSKRVYENEWTSSGVPFYGGREIVKLAMGISPVVSAAHISEKKYCELATQYDMPKEGNILMTARGTIGVGYVVTEGDRFYYKDGNIISFQEKTPTNPWFILFAFRTKLIRDQLGTLTGATVQHLPIEKANALTIKMPCFSDQNSLVETMRTIETETQRLESTYQQKLTALDALKKSLLHQAFSGAL